MNAEKVTRRDLLADAAIAVLAREGARGLTHRAVDAEAGVPAGTTSNHFRTRDALFEMLGQRIDRRLRPDPAALAASAAARPSRKRMVELMRELMARILADGSLQIAMLELRLEATRRPALRAALTETLQRGLDSDLAFHRAAKLPGGRREIVLLHLAIDGLILDRLTSPDALGIDDLDRLIEQIVMRILPK